VLRCALMAVSVTKSRLFSPEFIVYWAVVILAYVGVFWVCYVRTTEWE
jgi:hypothetical protein